MKKLLFLAVGLVLSKASIAQNYPGDMPQLLLKKELKVLPIAEASQIYGYRDFYTTADMNYSDIYKRGEKSSTIYSELVGKTFTVENVASVGSEKYPAFRLTLKSSEGLPELYYKYDPKYDHSYNFEVVGGLKFPDGFFCKDIKVSNTSSGASSQTPVYAGMTMTKEIVNGKPDIFFMMNVPRDSAMVTKNGVTFELQNGKIIKKPLGVVGTDINSHTGGFLYTVGTGLTVDDLKLLSESPIVKVKTSIFDEPVDKGWRIMQYAKCLLK